jgi:Cytidylate kinase-like family
MAPPYRVFCVSHLTGAEGEAVARGVAERMGFRYLDEEIIETAAEWVDLHPSVVGEVERRKSLMTRIGESMRGQSISERPDASAQRRSGGAGPREMPADEDLRALIRDVIREAAEGEDIVIASHAASMVLADRGDAFRVLVTASQRTRRDRIAGERNLDPRRAEKVLAEEDAARADYLKRFHGVELELPTHYDLVINTDHLPPERGAHLIVAAAGGGA